MIAFGLLFAVISSLRYILPLFTKRATPRFVAYLPSGIAFGKIVRLYREWCLLISTAF
jgi:hypothetical protein